MVNPLLKRTLGRSASGRKVLNIVKSAEKKAKSSSKSSSSGFSSGPMAQAKKSSSSRSSSSSSRSRSSRSRSSSRSSKKTKTSPVKTPKPPVPKVGPKTPADILKEQYGIDKPSGSTKKDTPPPKRTSTKKSGGGGGSTQPSGTMPVPGQGAPLTVIEQQLLQSNNPELGKIMYERRTGEDLPPPSSGMKTISPPVGYGSSVDTAKEVGSGKTGWQGPMQGAEIQKEQQEEFVGPPSPSQFQRDGFPTSQTDTLPDRLKPENVVSGKKRIDTQTFRNKILDRLPDDSKAEEVLTSAFNIQDMAAASGITPQQWQEIQKVNEQNVQNLEQAKETLNMVKSSDVEAWEVDGEEVSRSELINMLEGNVNEIEEAIGSGKVKIGEEEYVPGQDTYGRFLKGFEKEYDEAVYEGSFGEGGVNQYYAFVPRDTYVDIQREVRLGQMSEEEAQERLNQINTQNMMTKPKPQRDAWAQNQLQFENPEITNFREDIGDLITGTRGPIGWGLTGGGSKDVLKKLAREYDVDPSLVDEGKYDTLQEQLVSSFTQKAVEETGGKFEPTVGYEEFKAANPAVSGLEYNPEEGSWNVEMDYESAQRKEMRNLWEENPLAAVGRGTVDVISQYPKALTTAAGYGYRSLVGEEQPSYQDQLFGELAKSSYGISQSMRKGDASDYWKQTVFESPAMTDVYLPVLGGAAFSAAAPTIGAASGRLGSWVTSKTGGRLVGGAGKWIAAHPGAAKAAAYGLTGGLVYGPTAGPAAYQEYVTGEGETGSTAEAAARSTLQLGGFLTGAGSTLPGSKGKRTIQDWGRARADSYMTSRGYVRDPKTGKWVQDPYKIRTKSPAELEEALAASKEGFTPDFLKTKYQGETFAKGWESYAQPKIAGGRFAKYRSGLIDDVPKLTGNVGGTQTGAMVQYQPSVPPRGGSGILESGRLAGWKPFSTDIAAYNQIQTGTGARIPQEWGSLQPDLGGRIPTRVTNVPTTTQPTGTYPTTSPRQSLLGEYGLQFRGGTGGVIRQPTAVVEGGVRYQPTLAKAKEMVTTPSQTTPSGRQTGLWEYDEGYFGKFTHKPTYKSEFGEYRRFDRGRFPDRFDRTRVTERGEVIGNERLKRSRIEDLQRDRQRFRGKKETKPTETKDLVVDKKGNVMESYGRIIENRKFTDVIGGTRGKGDSWIPVDMKGKGIIEPTPKPKKPDTGYPSEKRGFSKSGHGKITDKKGTIQKVKGKGKIYEYKPRDIGKGTGSGRQQLVQQQIKPEVKAKKTYKVKRIPKTTQKLKLNRIIKKRNQMKLQEYSKKELRDIRKSIQKEKEALEKLKRLTIREKKLLNLDKKVLKDIDNQLKVSEEKPLTTTKYEKPTIVKSQTTGEPILVTGREGNVLYGESLYEVPGSISNYWQGASPLSKFQQRGLRQHELGYQSQYQLLSQKQGQLQRALQQQEQTQIQKELLAEGVQGLSAYQGTRSLQDTYPITFTTEQQDVEEQTAAVSPAQQTDVTQAQAADVIQAQETDTLPAVDTKTALDTDTVIPYPKPYPPYQPTIREPVPQEPKPTTPGFLFPKFPGAGSAGGGGGGRYYPQRRGYFEREYDVPDIWGKSKLSWGGKQTRLGSKKPNTFSLIKK